MEVDSKLLWIQLSTVRHGSEASFAEVYNLILHSKLKTAHVPNKKHHCTDRWSPAFVVGESSSLKLFNRKPTGSLWLFFDTSPIRLAALIQNALPTSVPHAIFLTHGMASVLLLVKDRSIVVDLEPLFAESTSLVAIEEWTLENGIILEAVPRHGLSAVAQLPRQYKVVSLEPDHLPHAVHRQAEDNKLAFSFLLELCKAYRPFYYSGVGDIIDRCNELLTDLRAAAGNARNGSLEAWQKLQARAVSLTHLNSMLAYVTSQGLGGSPPLLKHHGLLPSYSLFGVATAYQAVWGITHFIEEGFAQFDLLSEVQTRYCQKPSVDFSTDIFRPELDDMKAQPLSKTRHIPGHANLFSGRLGFHSSYWAVAAPVDTLYDASSPGRNLLTLSHELLHVHVENLLLFILYPIPTAEDNITQDELYVRMISSALENTDGPTLTIVDRIRQKIARYVLQSAACTHDTAPFSQLPRFKGSGQYDKVSPLQFKDMLRFFTKRVSEYIVHVLDFYYFYNGDVDHYLELILSSWASIPSVYDDIGYYIMRCLLTISTREMKPDTGVGIVEPLDFETTLKSFKRAVDGVAESCTSQHLTDEIKSFLKDPEQEEYLRLEFNRAKPLVWMTVMYFYCRPLRLYYEVGAEVHGGILKESKLCPDFEFGAVNEKLPTSPVAFLSRYLKRDYAVPDELEDIPTEAASIWLFAWIASSFVTEGGVYAATE